MDGQHLIGSSDDRTRSWLILAAGLIGTVAVVFALVSFWPDSDEPAEVVASDGGATTTVTGFEPGITDGLTGETSTSQGRGEPSRTSTTEDPAPGSSGDLFGGDFAAVFEQLLGESGNPTQILEVSVYPEYAFLAYRDPAHPGNIDERDWRDGEVGEAKPNLIDDRVDESTEPSLFDPSELDSSLIPQLVADAPRHYDLPTEVSHIIVDRFLPFDDRVLIRVYATPTDGRSGGGYVSYDTSGTLVKVCC